jgi:hypothetical protein
MCGQKKASQMITEQLLSWPEVTSRPHRFGGVEFLYRGKEIGHLHGDHLVDILFSRQIRDALVESGRARPHHIFPESGWVSVYVHSNEDAANAVELLRMKYDGMARA